SDSLHKQRCCPKRTDNSLFASLDGFVGGDSGAGRDGRDLGGNDCRTDAQLLAQLGVDAREDFLIFFQERAHVLAALADALSLEAVPGAALVDDAVQRGEVEGIALLGDSLAVEDVELGVAEGSGDLVLDDLDLGARADDDVSLLDRADAANVDAHGGVELERLAAGGGLGVSEHDADLLADLVNKDEAGARLGDGSGELAQGLAHEAGL